MARTAGADKYAADEYSAAAIALQKSRDAVAQRDYRLALNYAIDARQRSQDAIKQAGGGRARAQHDADALMTRISALATELQTRLRAAEASRVPLKDLRSARTTVAAVDERLQEARTAIAAGNYDQATTVLTAVREKLDAALHEIEHLPPHPVRRLRQGSGARGKARSGELRGAARIVKPASALHTGLPPSL